MSQGGFAGGNGAFMPAGQMDDISRIIDMAEIISMYMPCALSAFYKLLCGGDDWEFLRNKRPSTNSGIDNTFWLGVLYLKIHQFLNQASGLSSTWPIRRIAGSV